jgi:hypothetical protein
MAEGTEKIEEGVKTEREEIFSKSVRAGKRTYFFDVKTTRRNDYYLTLTESKKRFNRDGRFYFEKHKIFLYKEDFEKFIDGLTEAIDYIKANAPEILEEDESLISAPASLEEETEEITDDLEMAENQDTDEVDEEASGAETEEEETEEEAGEALTESFSNVEFEDLEDTKKS